MNLRPFRTRSQRWTCGALETAVREQFDFFGKAVPFLETASDAELGVHFRPGLDSDHFLLTISFSFPSACAGKNGGGGLTTY